MSVLSKTWAGDLVAMKQHFHVNGLMCVKNRHVELRYTWVRHVFELRASSDHQESQVEDVECHYNQEKYLHALENTELDYHKLLAKSKYLRQKSSSKDSPESSQCRLYTDRLGLGVH